MRDLKLVAVFIFVVAAIAACGGPAANNSTPSNANKTNSTGNSAATPSSTANSSATAQIDGKQLYTESCQICHKDTGKGGPTTVDGKKIKASDLTSDKVKTKHTDDDIAKDISEGSPDDGMPAFKAKLKPEEIKAVVGYIRTLQQQ